MSAKDPNKPDSLSAQLSGFHFGPSWAKEESKSPKKKFRDFEGESHSQPRRGREERRRMDGKGPRRQEIGYRERTPRRPLVEPTAGISCKLQPCKKAIEAIGQQIHKTGHTYPVYTLAKFVLGDRARYVLYFEATEEGPELFRGKLLPALVLSRQEAIAQLWQGGLLDHFYLSEEVEIEAPSGEFKTIAKCGMSGTLLGPPNHHSYQAAVAKLHRERFAHLPLDRFKARIESVTDEESIDAWKQQASKITRFRIKTAEGEAGEELADVAAVEKHFSENHFDAAFESGKRFVIPGNISAAAVSPGLLEWIKSTSSEARKKPSSLIPTLCSVLTGQRIAVFKWDGKLHTGPSRPHALPLDASIADGPAKLLERIGKEAGVTLQTVVGEFTGLSNDDSSEEAQTARRRVLSDLQWLLKEGFALLLEGGQLHVPKTPIKDRPKEEQEAMIKSQQVQAAMESKAEPEKENLSEASTDAEASVKSTSELSDTQSSLNEAEDDHKTDAERPD